VLSPALLLFHERGRDQAPGGRPLVVHFDRLARAGSDARFAQ
jgi:hypothetical protein